MVNTTNYNLEKYEAGNAANLLDQYNNSMDKLDAAFVTALGINSENATNLGTILNHILNRTGTETFTVTDLSKLKKTAEGYPIPPAK